MRRYIVFRTIYFLRPRVLVDEKNLIVATAWVVFCLRTIFSVVFLAMFRQRPTGECNVFKIKSGGFTCVIRLSGSDRRLTERIFCIHYFGMVLERIFKYFTTIMLRPLNVVNFHSLMFVYGTHIFPTC